MLKLLFNSGLPLRTSVGALLAIALSAGQHAPAAAPERFPIATGQVAPVLESAHLPVSGAEVRLLAQVTATTIEPQLGITAIEPWSDRGAHVRVVCTVHEQCLPFYISVRWPDPAAARQALLSAGVALQSINRAEGVVAPELLAAAAFTRLPASQSPASLPTARTILPGHVPADPGHEALRAGTHATLLLDGNRLHIEVPVICLENGEPGRTIRVTGLDHRQTYSAQIVDGTKLKGTL